MSASTAARLALYLVADPDQTTGDFMPMVAQALAAGVTAVQLRTKNLSDRGTLALAAGIRARCTDQGALFLINDRVDLALVARADGVHLGVTDVPVPDARRLGGATFIVGYSPETDEQVCGAAELGADYLGVGPVFPTTSKHDAGTAFGCGTLARRARLTTIPVIGIGGITAGNTAEVIRAGAVGVAVVSSISRASDPRTAAAELLRAVAAAQGGNDA